MQCVIIPNCVFMVMLAFIVSITTTARTFGKAGLAYPGLTSQTNLQESASALLRAACFASACGCSRAPPKRQRRRQSRRWSLMVPSSLKHLGMMLLIYNVPRLLQLLHWFRPSSFMVSNMQRCAFTSLLSWKQLWPCDELTLGQSSCAVGLGLCGTVSLCAYAMGCAVAFGLSCTVILDAGWAVTVAFDCATDSCAAPLDLGCNVGLSHACSQWRDVFERRLPRYRPRRWHCRPWLFDQHAITWRVLVRRALTRVARTRRVALARRALCTIAYSVQHVLTRRAALLHKGEGALHGVPGLATRREGHLRVAVGPVRDGGASARHGTLARPPRRRNVPPHRGAEQDGA